MKFKYPSSGFVFNPMCYDDIPDVVDKASFRPDSEAVRALRTLGSSDGSTLLYDYDDGKVPEKDTVSDVVLALRSGTLDKAEVQTLETVIADSAVSESKSLHDSAVSEAVDKALNVSVKSE